MHAEWIIQDIKSGKYVAYPGSKHSFTRNVLDARRFCTRDITQSEACPDSERVIPLSSIIGED